MVIRSAGNCQNKWPIKKKREAALRAALRHADFGEGVVAVLTPKPGASLEEKTIQAAPSNELAKFKQPKRIFITNELPRNAMGKIQKKELRDEYANVFAG